MLSAASQRIRNAQQSSPSSSLSPAERNNRRLSRLSPSEFDSILSTNATVKLNTTTRDEDQLGVAHDLPSSPDPASPSHSPQLDRRGTAVVPPLLSPEPTTPGGADPLKRRSMFRSVGNASSPDLSSLLKKAKEGGGRIGAVQLDDGEQEVLDDPEAAYEDADESGGPTSPSSPPRQAALGLPSRTPRSRSTTSPTISRTAPRAPHSPPQQSTSTLSVPSSANNSVASRSSDKPRLSSMSTFSTGSYVDVPVRAAAPVAQNGVDASRGVMGGANASVTSLGAGIGFDFSPKRKKSDAGPGDDGKLSLAGTMRKTSRFFRKFGGGSAASKGVSAPNTPLDSAFAPPVPPLPTSYARKNSSSKAPPLTNLHKESIPRNSSVDIEISPRLVATSMAREQSQNSMVSDRSALTTSSSRSARRRSVSLTSPVLASSDPASTTVSRARRPSASPRAGTAEDDQLRYELRQWRLGVDGVLGVGGTSPNPGSSPTVGGRSTPSKSRMLTPSNGSPTLLRTQAPSPAANGRRPSLPEGKALPDPPASEIPAGVQQRSKSLPTSALLPPTADLPPSIRLVSPAATSSTASPAPSSASTATELALPPASLLPPASSSPSRASKRHSIAEPEGIGLGVALEPIAEGAHSRESSATSPAGREGAMTPVKLARTLSDPGAAAGTPDGTASPTPTKEFHTPRSGAGTPVAATAGAGAGAGASKSNQRAGVVRGSIVGYPPVGAPAAALRSLPASLAGSSASLGSSSVASGRACAGAGAGAGRRQTARQVQAAEDEAMSVEELEEKASGLAKRCWDEDESFLERRKIAEWLGSSGRVNVAALRYYIDNFDFAGLRLDVAFRRLCGKLYLKAETQQVDRILEQFSRRYFEDNPKTVYGSADVVHAVSYSLLLLNTDLHVVDTTTRMTRQQFIRNTLEAIRAQTGEDEHAASSNGAPALLFSSPRLAGSTDANGDGSPVFGSAEASASQKSIDRPRTATSLKSSSIRSGSGARESPAASILDMPGLLARSRTPTNQGGDSPAKPSATPVRSESLATVNSTHSARSLEANLQATLKDMYNATKSQPIYQSSSGSTLDLPQGRPSLSLLPGKSPYATWGGNVNRSASKRSGATSTVSMGSSSSYKRSSIRGMGGFLGPSSSMELGRPSSPTPSSLTSFSDENLSTAYGAATSLHAVPTIGFANSLSHTIIREQQEDDARSDSSSISVTSAELALLGAPWAKEGILQRKHYWETAGKRSRDKHWLQAFVVVSNGELKMFKFGSSGGMGGGIGGIGGGDWTSNASSLGSISLIHALCSAMPAPGYSRERPHCFVLTLPNGGSYFFQAGTPDLVAEWVATCNYWSARLSKEPLSGGVSNIEHGWNRVDTLGQDEDDYEEIASIRSGHSRVSHAGSAFSHYGSSANPLDRINIIDWKAPQVPLTASNLPEEAQLEALKRHFGIVEQELAHHNTLRNPMIRLYSPRSGNASKAIANWERKSQHLLTDGVKWTTYIDALTSAIRLRSLQRGKKEVEAMLESADADEDEDALDDDELAASLSPYEAPPSSIKLEPPAHTPAHSAESTRSGAGRLDSTTSQVSVATGTTGDEFFDSVRLAAQTHEQ
ncbi:hypothetical protein JCM10207_006712 [Rhodosporidiobolus poonsookiae]